MVLGDQPRPGHEGLGVLGVDAALDGVTRGAMAVSVTVMAQLLAGGDADLLDDQIDARDHLGDGCSTWMRVFISMK